MAHRGPSIHLDPHQDVALTAHISAIIGLWIDRSRGFESKVGTVARICGIEKFSQTCLPETPVGRFNEENKY